MLICLGIDSEVGSLRLLSPLLVQNLILFAWAELYARLYCSAMNDFLIVQVKACFSV
jgi:hypothetical protein